MAKKKKKKSSSSPTGDQVTTHDAVKMLVEGLQSNPDAARRVYQGSQFDDMFYVLGTEHVALKYLLDANGIFLGKTFMFSGKTASCKSQFGYEFGLQFMRNGGIFILIETENKTSPATLRAKLGPYYESGQFFFDQVSYDSVEKLADMKAELWQERMTFWLDLIKEKGLQRVPIFVLVDSLVGAGMVEAVKQVEAEGAAAARSTAGMARAASNTGYVHYMANRLVDTYTSVGFTNHLKERTMEKPEDKYKKGPRTNVGGGDSVGFQCAMMLDFERDSAQKGVNDAGRFITIKTRKASFGQDERKIKIPFDVLIEHDEEGNPVKDKDGNLCRTITFDWDEAVTMLIEDHCISGGKRYSAAARQAFHVDRKGGKYSSKTLGVKDLDSSEFGKAVLQNMDKLENLLSVVRFSINRYKVVAGYDDKLEAPKASEEEKAEEVNEEELSDV